MLLHAQQQQQLISAVQEQVECLLCCFMLEDLRRFQAWEAGATRPYTGGCINHGSDHTSVPPTRADVWLVGQGRPGRQGPPGHTLVGVAMRMGAEWVGRWLVGQGMRRQRVPRVGQVCGGMHGHTMCGLERQARSPLPRGTNLLTLLTPLNTLHASCQRRTCALQSAPWRAGRVPRPWGTSHWTSSRRL